MTNNRGYIYVLANSAMPDLVKVGKTTRTPAERAAELSKVTGVPTPFIVVYEQLVDDCTAAEEFVHTMLQQKCYRESDNREFFRAPVSEVIQIIIKMPAQFSSNSDFEDDEDAEFFSSEPDDELDEFVLDDEEDEEPDYPWLALWRMAKNYDYGLNDCIQDSDEAMKLYKQAIKLGCLPAYTEIGNLYLCGLGVTQSDTKALQWYKEGIKKGYYFGYIDMSNHFASLGQYDNAQKSYKLFFKNRKEHLDKALENFKFIDFEDMCTDYLEFCFANSVIPLDDILKEISTEKSIILWKREIKTRFPNYEEKRGSYSVKEAAFVALYEIALKWIDKDL
jgi:hypothetical protein